MRHVRGAGRACTSSVGGATTSVRRTTSPVTNSWSAHHKVSPARRKEDQHDGKKKKKTCSPSLPRLPLFPLRQCTATWVSGASGAPALGPGEPVGSSGARRPARGRYSSTRRPLATPAPRCQSSKSAWSRGGNVQVKTTIVDNKSELICFQVATFKSLSVAVAVDQ